jgi:xanthine phosphoribosyltransferase
MLQARLGCDLEWLWLNFRADDQRPVRPRPELVRPITFEFRDKRILLVDDRSTSGSTLGRARDLLAGAKVVKTLVVNGRADYSLFDDQCFYFPWRMDIPPGTETETKESP